MKRIAVTAVKPLIFIAKNGILFSINRDLWRNRMSIVIKRMETEEVR